MEYFRPGFHLDKKTGRDTGKNQESEGGNGYAECIRQNTSVLTSFKLWIVDSRLEEEYFTTRSKK
jgi:hypothetical protein